MFGWTFGYAAERISSTAASFLPITPMASGMVLSPPTNASAKPAERRWSLMGVTVIHRHGRIAPGEDIVLVLTASSHRHEAFAAAEFLMDYLKTQAPFWKRVERAAGASWVAAKQSDDSAADRWTKPPGRRDAAE